jgi:hypothetical protein
MGIGGKVFHVCKHIDQMPSSIKVKFPTSMVGHLGIGDNYKIYGLIIVKTTKQIINARLWTLKCHF